MASGRILWQVTGKNIFEEIYGKWQDTMASVRKKIFEVNVASCRILWQLQVKKYLRRYMSSGRIL